ncbi:MAG: hypothetical protein WBA10_01740 [Elainellaceae cyanobacterium]
MTSDIQSQPDGRTDRNTDTQQTDEDKILCPHCRRTASNGVKCKGICVADNDY